MVDQSCMRLCFCDGVGGDYMLKHSKVNGYQIISN